MCGPCIDPCRFRRHCERRAESAWRGRTARPRLERRRGSRALRYFLDTEFNGFCGALISLALAREDGASVYYVFELVEPADPWVAQNVLPTLWACPVEPRAWTRREAAEDLAAFLAGDPAPVVTADWPEDVAHLCGLIVVGPGRMVPIANLNFSIVRLEAYPSSLVGAVQHNAWWDAMALRRRMEELGR